MVDNRIPQGSRVSPVLFNLYISDLLRRLEAKAGEKGMAVYFPTFIEDVTTVLAAETREEGRWWSKELLEEIGRWATEK